MSYAEILRGLVAELEAIADQSPAEAMMSLGPATDTTAADGVVARLREARWDAAARAIDDAGSQADLARQLDVSPMLVSRLARRASRH